MIKTYRIIILSLISLITFNAFSQETAGFTYDVYGYVNAQYFYNTRKNYAVVDGLFSLYPLPPLLNEKGEDLNAVDNHYFSVSTTRIGTKLNFGKTKGADIFGVIEVDFTGQADGMANYLRLRHAYIQTNWEKAQLLVGQYWNPMTLPQMMPSNKEMHNGAPFHPFGRLYQIRLEYQPAEKLNILSVLSFQRDYATIGVSNSKDYTQQIRSFIPITNLHLQYVSDNFFAGIGGEFKAIKPRETFLTPNNQTLRMNETMYNFSTSAYFNYKVKNHDLKSQAIIGDNLNDMTILGGYYESAFDTINNKFNYHPTTTFASWLDYTLTIGDFKPGLLLGYTMNLDIDTKGYINAYGLGMNIDNYYRISPRLEYTINSKFSLSLCVEYQNVKFNDVSKRVKGYKLALNATYNF
ncbi:MAG: hypothetical protein PHN41_04635 [Bacteroidales bacterium]|jgi:hypothetical protein|nr:hypothetical protein [Bacteroidales bacterium]MDD4702977.1 hypothetical protein [Bacteroidales bacterium]MDX9797644.1 hypothetical protein [Bacteroidales bacterium]